MPRRRQPTDAELNAYLQAHPDQFRTEPRVSFRQLYLNPEKRGKCLARDAAQMLDQLNQAGGRADIAAVSDSLMVDREFKALPEGELVRLFGDKFATAVDGLPPGRWQGPVESAYGVHLVLVSERIAGRMPALADVRDAVRREWQEAHRLEANEKFYRGLLERYTVTIEQPAPAEASNVPRGK